MLVALPGRVAAQDSSLVSGTLTYNERVALPANAVVTVQIARIIPDRPADVMETRPVVTLLVASASRRLCGRPSMIRRLCSMPHSLNLR